MVPWRRSKLYICHINPFVDDMVEKKNKNNKSWVLYKKKIIKFVYHFYYVIDTMYIYSWKRNYKMLTHFGDALCKK